MALPCCMPGGGGRKSGRYVTARDITRYMLADSQRWVACPGKRTRHAHGEVSGCAGALLGVFALAEPALDGKDDSSPEV